MKKPWIDLPYASWRNTAATLHRWTQIAGKIRMVQTPWENHSWHVTLRLNPRGLTTGAIPYEHVYFSLSFDFIDHFLVIRTSEGERRTVALEARPTAEFYQQLMETLDDLGFLIEIHTLPNEIANAIAFDQDHENCSYDGEAVRNFWQVLANANRVFSRFRADYHGKCSPVHFFWGGFDLAVTRFSGRPAPDHPGGMPNMPLWVAREAYSQEVSSVGFWPGNDDFPEAVFYSYAYPSPEGFAEAGIAPPEARWHDDLGEFVLPLSDVCQAPNPDQYLLEFLQSTFDAAARLGKWDLQTTSRRHFPDR